MSETQRPATASVSTTQPLTKDVSDFLLAEYGALRAELLKRSETQHQLISLGLIASGTFLTVGLQGSTTVMLVYPILIVFLAAAWAQNDFRIRQIGAYIKKRIEERFLSNGLGWEHVGPSASIGQFGSLSVLASRGIFIGTEVFILFVSLLKTSFPKEDIILIAVDGLAIIVTAHLIRRHKIHFQQEL